ncbi:MAG: MazG nucleotide pyrophosphohydrolase domain-containing protein [Elusimicrobiota bacterium]
MWDREQTHKSLIRHLKEESNEVIDAIEKDDKDNLKEELGDLLYQVIFHSEIASEAGHFNIWDVILTLSEKLIRRHPHIFGNVNVSSVDDIIKNWGNIKKQEKKTVRPDVSQSF